ncbi:ion channel nompc-like protein [Leptotrombidium deliense]|uniref:Ion channel nompc-like protein n=1 Tax=Leptotrombidium deliense TaxID=299467 RepID=A0A443SJX5_9ACAR|nr:ion channel nompc-like protein [Leptotrombidium deliense]
MAPLPEDKKNAKTNGETSSAKSNGNSKANNEDEKSNPDKNKIIEKSETRAKDALLSATDRGRDVEPVTVHLSTGQDIKVLQSELDFDALHVSNIDDQLNGVITENANGINGHVSPTGRKPAPVSRNVYANISAEKSNIASDVQSEKSLPTIENTSIDTPTTFVEDMADSTSSSRASKMFDITLKLMKKEPDPHSFIKRAFQRRKDKKAGKLTTDESSSQEASPVPPKKSPILPLKDKELLKVDQSLKPVPVSKTNNVPTTTSKDSSKKSKAETSESETEKSKGSSSNKESGPKSTPSDPTSSEQKDDKGKSEPTDSQPVKKRIPAPTQRLLLMCKKGDWLAVDTLLKYVEPSELDLNMTIEGILWTPVMFAAQDNRVNIIEKLLDIGYNVNARAVDGITALHLACAHAREDTIRLLLARKADPLLAGGPKNQLPIHVIASKPTGAAVIPLQLILRSSPKEIRLIPDSDGNIPLFLAVETGNHGVCRELLMALPKEQTALVKPITLETTAHTATKKRDMEMLRLVVDAGCDVNARNSDGQTPLHIVSYEGDETYVKYFYTVGADPNAKDIEDRTPLHLATEKGHFRIVDLLTEKFKASIYQRTKDGSTVMHIASRSGHPATAMAFMKKGVPLHMPNKTGAKAIHMAAISGQVDVIKTVLSKGEFIDVRTNEGLTALHLAVQASEEEVVETLLGYGANVSLKAGRSGETPLHIAAKIPDGKDCTELLIKSGADIDATQENGETALHYTGRFGVLDTFIVLLSEGANPSLCNKKGENVLHVVVKECHFQVAQQLILHVINSSGKDTATKLINQKNELGESSLHYAASIDPHKTHYPNEDRDLMRLLLQNDGDVSLGTNESNETVIHYCSKSGNTNVLNEIIGNLPQIDAQSACNQPAKSGWSPLLYACYYGHPDVIKVLLTQNARVDVFDERGRAGLHLAAELGHEDVCDILLENNAFVNVRNKGGSTPLHLAAKQGFNSMIKNLVLKHGALLDAMTLNKQTPLHLAAENGQLEVCKTLLQMRADINATDNQAQNPLHLAAQSNHPDVLKLFLQHKPELVSVANKNGYTCAHIAAVKGSVAVLKELMKFNQEAVKTARIKKTGCAALHLAAEGGHVKVVRLLLQTGAKASDENVDGYTPLHLAAKEGHVRVLHALRGAVDWKICSRKCGLTALHVASSCGQLDFVSEMLTQVPAGIKSERSLKDPSGDYGITPLHLASQNGHESVVRLLMNSTGVQVDAPTQVHGTIPLHLAAQGGHMLVAGLLINRSADSLFKTDKQGRTCVHLAAAHGHQSMVGLLLGQGAEINAQDKKGWTPLHHASKHGFLDVVQLLTDSGADPTATSKDEKIPICCAAAAGHYHVISYLLKKEHDSLQLMEDKAPIQEFILVSEAPIDTAVKLAKQYENLALREKERTRDLEAACQYADQLAIDLLSIAATTYNAGALLRALDPRNSEFLDVLIELERKDVVSQHAVQKYLSEVWMGNLKWSGFKFVILFFAFLFCPIIWIVFSCPIGHRFHRIPIIKFMSYLTSHIFFIAILTYTTVFPKVALYEYDWIPLWNEIVFLVWIIGILVSDLTNPTDRSGLGAIKMCIIFIGFCACILHLITFVLDLFIYNPLDHQLKLDLLYGRNQLLAVCMLLSFVEFLNFLTFHPLFGPWGVIIQELIRDLLLFLSILSIFMTGFTLHICAIYRPVYSSPDDFNATLPLLGQEFIEPTKSFEMLFFAIFGLVEPDNMPPMHLSPSYSKTVMKLVFGIYMMVTVVVLVNLLIAMMSNTYQRIEAQSDIEWKFGRAKLIRNMNRTLSTPSPINLFIGLPAKGIDKIVKFYQEKKEKQLKIAKQAFGHLSDQRLAVMAKNQWMHRRASRASRISRITGATSGFGNSELGFEESKPIGEVVNWAVIVQKYYESIGAAAVEDVNDDETRTDEDGSQIGA